MVSNTSVARVYMTAKEDTHPCTFTMRLAKAMIGQTMPGTIRRVECAPYSMVIRRRGKGQAQSHLC